MPNFTREELHKLIWTDPMRTVAQRFGISDVGLKKHCISAGIPVPERGYWAKLAAGKHVEPQWLPPRDAGADDVVKIGRESYRWNSDPEAQLAEPLPETPEFVEPLEAVRERVERRLGKVKSVRDLESPHAGLRKLLERDKARAAKYPGSTWSWERPQFAEGFERRRMCILNSLALGLSKVGVRLDVRGGSGREVSVRVGDTYVSLSLDHPKAKPNHHGEWPIREGPTAELKLIIGKVDASSYRPVWADDADGKLEAKLTQIVLEIMVAGEAIYRERRLAHHQWLVDDRARLEREVRKRREEAERLARERRAAEEKARRDLLLSQAQAWRSARDIRGFVAEVLESPLVQTQPEGTRRWAAWALHEADLLDPVNGSLTAPQNVEAVDQTRGEPTS